MSMIQFPATDKYSDLKLNQVDLGLCKEYMMKQEMKLEHLI